MLYWIGDLPGIQKQLGFTSNPRLWNGLYDRTTLEEDYQMFECKSV